MKPIETEYAGYRFRSRLEARWAVFFDTADIEFRYEPEGFVLPWSLTPAWSKTKTFRYLPDFYLPGLQMWAEVKADWNPGDRIKFFNAAFAMNEPFLVLGDVFQQPRGGARRPFSVVRRLGGLYATPWPDNENFRAVEAEPIDLLRGHKSDTPAPDWYVTAARAAQRARFEFGQTPGRPTL